jgi:hypothetical protein
VTFLFNILTLHFLINKYLNECMTHVPAVGLIFSHDVIFSVHQYSIFLNDCDLFYSIFSTCTFELTVLLMYLRDKVTIILMCGFSN